MRRGSLPKQKGQSLVIIAFAMVVLILFAMFAVDVSFAYVQRRQMQNAADAAALAGARELTIAQGQGDEATLTNGGLYAIILDWARRNQAQTVQALYIRPNQSTFAINAGDGAIVPNVATASGVYVKACTNFPTFFSRFVGLNFMNMCAEAEASFGAAWAVRGMAPLAVLYSDFQVGDEYSLFAGNYKHAAARWGWLGLDCQFPSKCSPDANSLQNWMEYGYQGYVSRNSNYMADPGMKESVLHEANLGQVLILPLFDKIYQYTTAVQCDKNSPHYDPNYCANACKQDYANVVCAYTDVNQLKGQYYYHIIAFAAFEVSNVGQHQLDGKFVSYIVDGTWTNPSPWDKGVVVMRLTERDKPTVTPVSNTPAPLPTSTPVITPRIIFDDSDTLLCEYDAAWRNVCGTVELPVGTSARLQMSWNVVHPDDSPYASTQYVDGGIVQNGSRFCIQAYWPGIQPDDMIVDLHIGGMMLDANTNNPITAQAASLNYTWYHWYCAAPTPGATATSVPPTSTPAGPTPTSTPVPPTPTPCSTPNAPTALSGWRSGDNVYLSWNAPSGPPPNEYRIYWATTGDGQYGYLTSTTSTSYSYKTNGAGWYYVRAYNTCGEGPASDKKYVPAR